MKMNKSLLLLSSLLLLTSCGDNNPPEVPPAGDPTLESISLSGNYETSFYTSDTFTYAGLVVTAHYDDNSSKAVTDYSVSTPNMSILGEQDVTVTYLSKTATYTITILDASSEEDDYEGYIKLAFYHIDITLNDNGSHYLNPEPIGYEPDPELTMPYEFTSSDTSIATVSRGGGIKSAKNKTGTCTITCTGDTGLVAKCTVNVLSELPTKEKVWTRVDDYDSLKDGDILVMASPVDGVTASLDTTHSKLNPVPSTFNNSFQTITSLGEGTIEFYLGIEKKGMTLEAQTGEYLICTHQGKVKLDSGKSTNKYWDIHSNVDEEEGTGSITDGAVIENDVESLGYMMYNVSQNYFSTYVDNSISQYMRLPFIYRLEEVR